MTTSRFMEQVSYRAAMETELAKSIKEISTIRGARVHLAEPQQSVFVRNQTPAKASVVVVPHPGRVSSLNHKFGPSFIWCPQACRICRRKMCRS